MLARPAVSVAERSARHAGTANRPYASNGARVATLSAEMVFIGQMK
jgi:hypothetical protein